MWYIAISDFREMQILIRLRIYYIYILIAERASPITVDNPYLIAVTISTSIKIKIKFAKLHPHPRIEPHLVYI